MNNQAFRVRGDFQMGRLRQTFATEVVAADEAGARELVLTDIGSRHGTKRRDISIASVEALTPDQVTDAVARSRL